MGGYILSGNGMPIGEQAVKGTTGERPATHRTKRPKGQGVVDMILKITGPVSVRFDPMNMIPTRKRAIHLAVTKPSAVLIIPVFGNPRLRKRPDPQAQDDPGSVFNTSAPLHKLDRLPGRSQALKSPRTRVPVEDGLGRGWNTGATGKDRHG